ncbi:MAG: hypothetical protein CMO01_18620 [Thalassobius sp.]|nr:hypothetical protein [Thalassovita sp.]
MTETIKLADIKAVLFDFDDTLVQTTKTKYEAIKAIGSRYYNHQFTNEMIDEHWGIAFNKFYHNLFAGLDTDMNRVMERRTIVTKEFPNQLFSDTNSTLSSLKKQCKLGIVSAASKDTIHAEIEQTGLDISTLQFIQSADDTDFHKPDPRVFEPALAQLEKAQIDKSEILYVGDSLKDFYAARDAGLHFVGIANVTTSDAVFTKERAAYVNSLYELLALV